MTRLRTTRLAVRPTLGLVALATAAVLSGCSSAPAYRDWTAGEDVPTIAFDECSEQVDNTMRLRGYPQRPLPETPQFQYRREIFAQCMRRKGYSTE